MNRQIPENRRLQWRPGIKERCPNCRYYREIEHVLDDGRRLLRRHCTNMTMVAIYATSSRLQVMRNLHPDYGCKLFEEPQKQ